MVRDYDAVAAHRDGALGVVRALNAFQEQLARPLVAQLLDVVPVEPGVHFASDRRHDVGAGRRAEAVALHVGHAGQPVAQHVERPCRLEDHVPGIAPVRAVGRMEAVARVALALARYRKGHRDENRLVARVPGPADELRAESRVSPASERDPPVARVPGPAAELRAELQVSHAIELEPQAPAPFLRQTLDRERRRSGHGKGHAPGLCRARKNELGAVASGADAPRGRDGEWQRRLTPENGSLGVGFRYVDEHFWQQADALERGTVVPQRRLVLGAAVEEVEDRARQAALRDAPQIVDIHRPGEVGHNCGVTLPSKGPLVSRLFAVVFCFALSSAAFGQAFPSKPMRIVVPFTPAGAVDIATRATANEMTKILGHPVAVENKPGAGGNLGVLDVARSAPDGYSMVMSTSGIQAIDRKST